MFGSCAFRCRDGSFDLKMYIHMSVVSLHVHMHMSWANAPFHACKKEFAFYAVSFPMCAFTFRCECDTGINI